jgi:hypothetical protein
MDIQKANSNVVLWKSRLDKMTKSERRIFISYVLGGVFGLNGEGDKWAKNLLTNAINEAEKWK